MKKENSWNWMALKVCPHSTVPKSDSKILCQPKEEALHSGAEHSGSNIVVEAGEMAQG